MQSNVISKKKRKQVCLSDRIFGAIVIILSILIFIMIAYPLYFLIIASISSSDMVNLGKVTFFPRDIIFYGYEQIFGDSRIWRGYINTIIYVIVGTALNLAVTLPAAYALSRNDFKARNAIMLFFVFTMFFNGGIVPTYMTVSGLHLISTRAIFVVFLLINTFNLIIARTFIENSIPHDLYEAAVLDGCSHFTYLMKIVIPLSKALIAVLVLYYAVYHWNDFFNALLFNSNAKYEPLQIVLRRILILNEAFKDGSGSVGGGYAQRSADQVKYAVMIISTVPILCFYPFIQKYFDKGVMIGAVKG